MLTNLKKRMNSDKAAMGSVETVLLVALSVFAVLAVYKFIIQPIQTSSEGIGNTIKEMNPE